MGGHAGDCEITFATVTAVDKAIDFMDRGQIDGNIVDVFLKPRPRPRSRSPPRRGGFRGGYQNNRGGFRGRGNAFGARGGGFGRRRSRSRKFSRIVTYRIL